MEIDRKLLDNKNMLLNLFDDVTIKMNVTRIRKGDTTQFEAREVWSGQIENAPHSNAVLYIYDDFITGRIDTGNRLFMIENAGNGINAVLEIDESKLVPEGDALPTPKNGGGK